MSAEDFSRCTVVVGQIKPDGVQMLGTGFVLSPDGTVATTYHVIGNERANLVVMVPEPFDPRGYQDLSNNQCNYAEAEPAEIDPLRDIAILRTKLKGWGKFPTLSSFDGLVVGAQVDIFGYPHCVHGRRSFTMQSTAIGAKVLLATHDIPSKHAVINVQARPGQSGSPVVHPQTSEVVGMLVGAWVPGGAGIRLGDINPYELHQTTHCISAQHIREML